MLIPMNNKFGKAARKVHEVFLERGLTLSVAESCTGGLLCLALTSEPGASGFFAAGVVAYTRETKEKILCVSSETIARYGMVSEQTAREMSTAMRTLSRTDFAVATTGNLGPDQLEGKERGLVYIAVSGGRGTSVKELRLRGSREENRNDAACEALLLLLKTAGSVKNG